MSLQLSIPDERLWLLAELLAPFREPLELKPADGGFAYRLLVWPSFRATTLVRIDGGAPVWQITGKMMSTSRLDHTTRIAWS